MQDSPNDVTIASYDANVDRYVASTPAAIAASVEAMLVELAGKVPGGRVLEIGSGPGREADRLEALGLSVDRTDATPAFVAALRQAGHDARLLDVRDGDLGGPYDAVLANAVLLHIARDHLEAVLRRVLQAVRPGGWMFATFKEGNGEDWTVAKLDAPRWFVYWREQPLRDLLERVGWRVERIDHFQGRTEPWLTTVCRRATAPVVIS